MFLASESMAAILSASANTMVQESKAVALPSHGNVKVSFWRQGFNFRCPKIPLSPLFQRGYLKVSLCKGRLRGIS
jgi:hypothetical protein